MARRPGGHRQAPELASSGPFSPAADQAPIAPAYCSTWWPAGLVRWPVFVFACAGGPCLQTMTQTPSTWCGGPRAVHLVARRPTWWPPPGARPGGHRQAPDLVPADLVRWPADQVARAAARGPWRRSRRQLTCPVSPGPKKTGRVQAAQALARFHTLGFT